MEQQTKWHQVDFYVGLLDSDEYCQKFTLKEAVDKITDLIGDCTIIPCIGSYKNPLGLRINMNTLHIIKFIKEHPKYFKIHYRSKFKEIFNQKSIIVHSSECENLEIL